eukprot:scaffold10054_cov140-Cylindrotheca_fusiformis.AAC.1
MQAILKGSFLSSRSTHIVTGIRLCLILISHLLDLGKHFPEKWLYNDVLISLFVHPTYSLTQIREAQSIQNLVNGRFADAYKASQIIHIPPLMLAPMQSFLGFGLSELLLALCLLLIDFMMAYMIEAVGCQILLRESTQFAEDEERSQSQLPEAIKPPNGNAFPTTRESRALFPTDTLPILAANLYYWSPISAISGGVFCCFQNIPAFFFLASLNEFVKSNRSCTLTAFYLATASYIQPHYCVILVPFILWLSARQYATSTNNKAIMITAFGFSSASMQWLSYRLVGPCYGNVLEASYGCGWNTISPNLSVQWFRDYFSTIILGLPYILVVPLTIRLHNYPMVLVAVFSLLWTVFAPIQTLFDVNFGICFFLFCPKSLARMDKIAFFALCCIPVPLLLNVVDQWMWLEANTGNANYVFFQCLAHNVFLCIIVAQFCSASLQRDKALRLAWKEQDNQSPTTQTVS